MDRKSGSLPAHSRRKELTAAAKSSLGMRSSKTNKTNSAKNDSAKNDSAKAKSSKPNLGKAGAAKRKAALPAPVAEKAAQSAMELRIGQRIAALRGDRGFTQDRLAAATGFTKGYVSKIENSKVIPPIGTLIKIAKVLNADLADLFDEKRTTLENDAVSIVRAGEREPVIRGGSSFGYDYVALAHKRRSKQMEPFIMVFPSEVDRDVRFTHEGEEFIFVLSGKIEFEASIGGQNQTWILSAGDSVYFDSHLPHRGRSLRGESRALVVIYRAK